MVTQLGESVSSPTLSAALREIVDQHLGTLSLNDLSSGDRDEVVAALSHVLQDRAVAELPADLPSRDSVLAHIADLVTRAERGGSVS